jgi:hypothetical protein
MSNTLLVHRLPATNRGTNIAESRNLQQRRNCPTLSVRDPRAVAGWAQARDNPAAATFDQAFGHIWIGRLRTLPVMRHPLQLQTIPPWLAARKNLGSGTTLA